MTVYADNAATTQMSPHAIETMCRCLKEEYGNPSSLHSLGQQAAESLLSARECIAAHLGCSAHEIYFTSGGSEANNQALLSAATVGKKKGKRKIISSAFEHHAILHVLERLEKEGFEIVLLDVGKNGLVSAQQVEDALDEDVCLVSIMHANNEIGTIQPIREIGTVCRKRNIPFHTDAVQTVGHIPLNVRENNIDMLSLSAHKFHGPKGIGALYVRDGIKVTSLIEGGAQERGKRAGTENLPAIMGMAAALKESAKTLEEDMRTVSKLRDQLIEGLSAIPHGELNGDRNQRLPGNVSFCFEGIEGESLLLLLDQKGICASSGSACTSGTLDPSHVLLAIGRPHEVAHGSLRLTLSPLNTSEEIAYIIQSVTETVTYLRTISPVWKDLQQGKKSYVIQ